MSKPFFNQTRVNNRRHRFFFALLKPLVRLFLCLKFNAKIERYKLKHKPCIILSNHNTDFDMLFVGVSGDTQMYFVGSEHIARFKAYPLIRFFFDPILRLKASVASQTAKDILATVRGGATVCLMAEGNKSFNGLTCPILPSTGKMCRVSGASLLTYRIEGGYFTSPRWAHTLRRGRMHAYPVREYSPEELRAMSADEINAAIVRDLGMDAYADQQPAPVAYRGKALAEWLETALYLCPECGKASCLHSQGDAFRCECGMAVRYTEYGYLETLTDRPAPFRTVTEWDAWQREYAPEYIAEAQKSAHAPITQDGGVSVSRVEQDSTLTALGKGTLRMWPDRMEVATGGADAVVFPFEKIQNMAIHGTMVLLVCTTDAVVYELAGDFAQPYSALKYERFYELLRG